MHDTPNTFVFDLYREDAQFRIDKSEASKPLVDLVKAADADTTPIAVEFDPSSGVVSDDESRPSFAVIAITHAGRRIAATSGGPADKAVQDSSSAAFVRGVAAFEAGYFAEAVRYVNSALAGTLPPHLRAAAFKVRGKSLVNQVYSEERGPTPEGDARLVAALEDLLQWARSEPNAQQARYEVAGVLRDLGAYDEAITVFKSVRMDWPNERYWPAIRIGATEREQGHYQEALKSLDDLAARAGPQTGMAFHYHRAWTLLDLNRPSEAVTELTSGLENQPAYAWAYIRRSCAFALLGQMSRALEDQRTALSLLVAGPVVTPAERFDMERAHMVERRLAQDVGSASSAPDKEVCGGYWRDTDQPRTRSSLLPQPALPILPKPHRNPHGEPTANPAKGFPYWTLLVTLAVLFAVVSFIDGRRNRARRARERESSSSSEG
jgi:tetratricopeptide (TPR) repeat protein